MKKIVTLFAALFSFAAVFAAPTITGVTAQQRYPWNGKVDISYTVNGDIAAHCKEYGLIPALKVSATDKAASKTYTATKISGDTKLTAGTHKIVWDMDAQGLSFKSANVVFNVACETTEAQYCVIDLSAGANATSYPVTYLATAPSGGFNVDEYKTTKLVLKRIASGSFVMGEDQSDQSHKVTLTKPFYMGLFEVTQKQWNLMTGTSKSGDSVGVRTGDTYPIFRVSYNELRGGGWPASKSPSASSVIGRLQTRTNIGLDLPTEAQWEYACRAGTKTIFSYGSTADSGYMNWNENRFGYAMRVVGSLKPNPWGLYDMHGNIAEWCLDWEGSLSYGEDPVGASGAQYRILRGGSYLTNEYWFLTSSARSSTYPDVTYSASTGFRLCATLP